MFHPCLIGRMKLADMLLGTGLASFSASVMSRSGLNQNPIPGSMVETEESG